MRLLAALTSCVSLIASVSFAGELSSPQALGPWVDTGWADPSTAVARYPSVRVQCRGEYLYPSHPQQDLKIYHVYRQAAYEAGKLKKTDRACLIHSNGKNSSGEEYCLRADVVSDVILSDVFTDACGHLYRGFVEKIFLDQDENMGTLISPGRTMYPNPRSEYSKDMISGGTYRVSVHGFVKIGTLFPGDAQRVRDLRKQALADFRYDSSSHLYSEIDH